MAMPTVQKGDLRPDWNARCLNCDSTPVVPLTGLCGPCNFGTAAAVNGDWWDEETDSYALED